VVNYEGLPSEGGIRTHERSPFLFKNDMEKRFVNIKEVQTWMQVKETMEHNISTVEAMHCRDCGDTKPQHGFYPLLGMAVGTGVYQTSGFICNRCALTDEEYLERFKEPKEIIE